MTSTHKASNSSEPERQAALEQPSMLMIGSGGRRCGKTTLACALIRQIAPTHSVTGVKVTAVHEKRHGKECPRGNDGCGVCSSLDGPYRLTEELGEGGEEKDTTRLLRCGADSVLWLCVKHDHIADGAAELLSGQSQGAMVVCESNSLRKVVEPSLFVVVQRHDQERLKQSCRDVLHLADAVVRFDGEGFDVETADFGVSNGRWTLRRKATAVVLAGGRSRRMGRDKALLPIHGRPMIEHIVDQLRPHFTEIVISSSEPEKYRFLGLEIITDRVPDQGPMMAISSVLERSTCDLNFVVSCDMPTVPIGLLNRMLRQARHGAEIVVPTTDSGRFEPLFALYRKSISDKIDRALEMGERRIRRVYDDCLTTTMPLRPGEKVTNVNTTEEYRKIEGSDQ